MVQDLDYSWDLTYADTTSLVLNGGWIRRLTTHPTTDVDIKLPPIRGHMSLAALKVGVWGVWCVWVYEGTGDTLDEHTTLWRQ